MTVKDVNESTQVSTIHSVEVVNCSPFRYNAHALVNRGNVHFIQGEPEMARQFYREAAANEASCVEALYNQGKLRSKKREENSSSCYRSGMQASTEDGGGVGLLLQVTQYVAQQHSSALPVGVDVSS